MQRMDNKTFLSLLLQETCKHLTPATETGSNSEMARRK
ncbi:unnamed protein product [Gulo gulo]|uniref:Uncharacterized protein n=1 Tax=Gulo gulo TaxID=48420 RepID=A0A9X9Q3E6_GULGU|nr:unnamed protein product [Gulo gulo]